MAVVESSSTEIASSCRKVPRDDTAGFMGNLKIRFHDFTNASMKDHKDCFNELMHKTKNRWTNAYTEVVNKWEKMFGRETQVSVKGNALQQLYRRHRGTSEVSKFTVDM